MIVTNADFLIFVVRAHIFSCNFRQLHDSKFQCQGREFLGNVISAGYACLKLWSRSYLTSLRLCRTSNGRMFSSVLQDGCPVSAVCVEDFQVAFGSLRKLTSTRTFGADCSGHHDTDTVNPRWFAFQLTHPPIRTSRTTIAQQFRVISVYKL